MSYQLDRYVAVRSVFQYITGLTDPTFCNMTTYKENKDSLALWLSVKEPETNKQLDYYYLFGDAQVHRYVDEADPRVMTTDSKKLESHILMDINDFVKGKTIA